ncbi:MAG: vWA domain-containing protein [Verrucomicrobiales bacterium]
MSTKHKAPPVTEIAYILDMSGSMNPHAEAAVTGFNDFLREQQSVEGVARITLVLFDDRYEVPFDSLPVGEVCSIDTGIYRPRGTTALLDAIGKTMKSFRKRIKDLPKNRKPDQVIFAIFTDGLENASRDYTWTDIADKIRKRQDKDGWEFLFLAAGQDAIATAAQMNVHAHNAATVDSNNRFSSRDSGRAMSRKVRAMREMDVDAADLAAPMTDILREEEGREDLEN